MNCGDAVIRHTDMDVSGIDVAILRALSAAGHRTALLSIRRTATANKPEAVRIPHRTSQTTRAVLFMSGGWDA
jgi:hypothetical protein